MRRNDFTRFRFASIFVGYKTKPMDRGYRTTMLWDRSRFNADGTNEDKAVPKTARLVVFYPLPDRRARQFPALLLSRGQYVVRTYGRARRGPVRRILLVGRGLRRMCVPRSCFRGFGGVFFER